MKVPALGRNVPRRGNRLTRALGRTALAALGWRFEVELPDAAKFIIVVAPHTSAWDFVIAIFAVFALGMRASWIGKDTLFRWPFGGVMTWLGGIPVDRSTSRGVVDSTVERFRSRAHLVLGIAPEGTRGTVARWKTGFYHIARGADVPIVPCYLDYAGKVIGTAAPIRPSGDLDADLAAIQSVYAGVTGKYPART